MMELDLGHLDGHLGPEAHRGLYEHSPEGRDVLGEA